MISLQPLSYSFTLKGETEKQFVHVYKLHYDKNQWFIECRDDCHLKIRQIAIADINFDTWEGPAELKALCEALLENERLHAALADPKKLTLQYEQGKNPLIEIEHWAVRLIADSFAKSLGEAPNYIEMEILHPEEGSLVVTIQRKHGESPGQQNARLRQQIEHF